MFFSSKVDNPVVGTYHCLRGSEVHSLLPSLVIRSWNSQRQPAWFWKAWWGYRRLNLGSTLTSSHDFSCPVNLFSLPRYLLIYLLYYHITFSFFGLFGSMRTCALASLVAFVALLINHRVPLSFSLYLKTILLQKRSL